MLGSSTDVARAKQSSRETFTPPIRSLLPDGRPPIIASAFACVFFFYSYYSKSSLLRTIIVARSDTVHIYIGTLCARGETFGYLFNDFRAKSLARRRRRRRLLRPVTDDTRNETLLRVRERFRFHVETVEFDSTAGRPACFPDTTCSWFVPFGRYLVLS